MNNAPNSTSANNTMMLQMVLHTAWTSLLIGTSSSWSRAGLSVGSLIKKCPPALLCTLGSDM
eukprot:2334174-Ditylum_brightwellii.AAC.1